jgi:hypothetical protein
VQYSGFPARSKPKRDLHVKRQVAWLFSGRLWRTLFCCKKSLMKGWKNECEKRGGVVFALELLFYLIKKGKMGLSRASSLYLHTSANQPVRVCCGV